MTKIWLEMHRIGIKVIYGELITLGCSAIYLYILSQIWAIELCLDLDDQRSRSLAKVKVIDKNLAKKT